MAGLEGAKLGAYELLERIGGGGMAEVYRAKQTTAFGREVAIKVIRPGYSEDQTFRERFLREAQAISKLSHPNILPLIEFGQEGETVYLVMPLAREGTLRDLLKQRNGPLPMEEAIPIFIQLCDAVQYAHEQGIVHRDLKPQNVLLQRKTHVLLADFGIARDSAETHLTATGAGIGTVEYMAPEQALGKADARSDIYSLGIVLYQLVTGLVPYSGSTPFQVIMRHTNEPLPDPRLSNPNIPTELVEILKTALAKDPGRRFQSAQALGRAVQQIRPDAAAPAQPGPQFAGPPPMPRSRPRLVPPDAPPTAPTDRLTEQQEAPRRQTWAGTSAGTASPPPPASPPSPTWAGGPAAPPERRGPPAGDWAASDLPPAPDYEQPTWSTSSGARQPAGGPPPIGVRRNQYGRVSGPPALGGIPNAPAPERRRNTRVIVLIAAALLLVFVLSAGAYAFSQGLLSGSASNGVAQQPTATAKATTHTEPTATNTTEPTATNTAEPTATNTPKPTATKPPTATPPTIISSGSGTLKGTFSFDFDGDGQNDVFWHQHTSTVRTMDPTSGATIVNVGVVNFNNITLAKLKSYSYSSTPLDGNNDSTNVLVTGDVFAVHTSGGHYAKVLIVAYGYDLQIQWVTYG